MSLRARLIISLLALALIPTTFFTLFTLDQLNRAIGRWYRPGVDLALESGLEVAKTGLTRLESSVLVQSSDWAANWPKDPLSARHRADLQVALRTSGLDFAEVYRRDRDRFSLAAQVVPERVIVTQGPDLGSEIAEALRSDRLIHSQRGALAAAAPLPGGDVLVAGMWMTPDFFKQVDLVTRGTTYYRQMGVYVDVQRRLVWILLAVFVLVLLGIAFLLATVLARGTSRPLGELARAIERVAAGELETRVAPRGALELRSLAGSFNAMASRLEAARVAVQLAEREAAWRDVARKLAHEFRNMLTPMQLSLQLLECEVGTLAVEKRRAMSESLTAALREVDHLSRLAEQFSQYARLPEPRFERLDLADVVRATAEALAPRARIELQATGEPVTVEGDPLLLSRAVSNLMLNAVEASPAGAAIEVRAAQVDGAAVVEVLDRGAGLPEAFAGRLFEPYVSTKQRGSGLGLSLTRDIARQHGGDVSLQNREGGGALARLTLPFFPAVRRAPDAPGSDPSHERA